jgi:hypothetical protein
MYNLSNHHFKSAYFSIIDFAKKIEYFDSAVFTELHAWPIACCKGTRDNFWTFDLVGADKSGIKEIRPI